MFLCIHTNKIHTDIKHTTEQIKKKKSICKLQCNRTNYKTTTYIRH